LPEPVPVQTRQIESKISLVGNTQREVWPKEKPNDLLEPLVWKSQLLSERHGRIRNQVTRDILKWTLSPHASTHVEIPIPVGARNFIQQRHCGHSSSHFRKHAQLVCIRDQIARSEPFQAQLSSLVADYRILIPGGRNERKTIRLVSSWHPK
jgi:hypothetical protein